MYRHMVLLKFKTDALSTQIDDIFEKLQQLTAKIPGLVAFSGGPYSSPEGLNKGFNYGFSMDFTTEAERDAYFPHPQHENVKDMILPLVDDVIAFDYAY